MWEAGVQFSKDPSGVASVLHEGVKQMMLPHVGQFALHTLNVERKFRKNLLY